MPTDPNLAKRANKYVGAFDRLVDYSEKVGSKRREHLEDMAFWMSEEGWRATPLISLAAAALVGNVGRTVVGFSIRAANTTFRKRRFASPYAKSGVDLPPVLGAKVYAAREISSGSLPADIDTDLASIAGKAMYIPGVHHERTWALSQLPVLEAMPPEDLGALKAHVQMCLDAYQMSPEANEEFAFAGKDFTDRAHASAQFAAQSEDALTPFEIGLLDFAFSQTAKGI